MLVSIGEAMREVPVNPLACILQSNKLSGWCKLCVCLSLSAAASLLAVLLGAQDNVRSATNKTK